MNFIIVDVLVGVSNSIALSLDTVIFREVAMMADQSASSLLPAVEFCVVMWCLR